MEAELRGGMGASGEIHVYDDTGENIVEKIAMDDRIKYPHGQ